VSVIGQPVGGIRATPEGEEPYIPSSPEADGREADGKVKLFEYPADQNNADYVRI